MARKTEYGKFIISAGEIGAYSVCPEAWRLSVIERVKPVNASSAHHGDKLHKEWAKSYDDAVFSTRGVKIILFLILLAILSHFVARH